MIDTIFKYFVQNRLLVGLLSVFVIILGLSATGRIKQEIFPMTDIDTMIITVNYPGASPLDVELNAVIPIEREIATITGINEYSSFSNENMSSIYVYIDQDINNKQQVKDEVYRKITKTNIDDISSDVEEIQIIDANPKLMAIMSIGVSLAPGSKAEKSDLFSFADELKDRLLEVDGVSDVDKNGYLSREIHIKAHPELLAENFISLDEVVSSIKNRNVRNTGGTLRSLTDEKTLIINGQFSNPFEVNNSIVRSTFEQQRVFIKDIAEVTEGFEHEYERVRINGERAVVLQVKKNENADIVSTARNIRDYIKTHKDMFPDDFNVKITQDQSLSIKSLVSVVITNASIGFILVFIVLIIFLDYKTSFWTAMGIPFSLLAVIFFMTTVDFSINVISLGAVIVVLGMMVDHGIVMSESIYKQRQSGMKSFDAVVSGVGRVIAPVGITVITTIVAFIPMFSIGGIMGNFIQPFPVIVMATMIISFLWASFLLPSFLASSEAEHSTFNTGKDLFKYLVYGYGKILRILLRHRYIVLASFISIFIATIILSGSTLGKFVLIWDDSSDGIYINLEAREGFSIDATDTATAEIENTLKKLIPESKIVSIVRNVGHHTIKPIYSKGHHENWSQIVINLVPNTERSRTAALIISDLRKKIDTEEFPDFERIFFEERVLGPSPGEAVNVKIVSNDIEKAIVIQESIEDHLKKIEGVTDIDNDQKPGKSELAVRFDYVRLAQLGLSVNQVARTVRTAYSGIVATSIQTPDERLDFRVKVSDDYLKDKVFLQELLILNSQGRLIKLKDVAKIEEQEGTSAINHYNGNRVVTVTASVDPDVTTSMLVNRKLQSKTANLAEKHPGIKIEFGGEAEETGETMGDLRSAFAIALILIYFILILLFKSFSQPLIVILSIPFGMIGALLAFTAHGIPMSFMGFIGIIGLAGVAVNGAVVMVEFINRTFRDYKINDKTHIIENIIAGAQQRLRPVILTTLTTSIGLLPTVYGLGGDVKSLVPAVMALTYGLLFATLLTLIFIPALYLINIDIKYFAVYIFKKIKQP